MIQHYIYTHTHTHTHTHTYLYLGLPGWRTGKESICQCRKCGFYPWGHPWRRAWQPTPVFLAGEPHGQRILAGYGPWGCKESDTTERLNNSKRGIHRGRKRREKVKAEREWRRQEPWRWGMTTTPGGWKRRGQVLSESPTLIFRFWPSELWENTFFLL